MSIEQINQNVMQLWEETFSNSDSVWMPLLYPPLRTDCLLFVGLNPSFSESGFRRVLAGTKHAKLSPSEFFGWENKSRFDLETSVDIEREAKEKYSYFKKFKSIAKGVGIDWEHIDLFFYRETNQNSLKDRILDKGKPNEFGQKQLQLSRKLIDLIRPKIIVVANALASNIFHDEFKLSHSEKFGCHYFSMHEDKIPVLLTSMLSGQRAMDTFSCKRLEWHIRYVNKMMAVAI